MTGARIKIPHINRGKYRRLRLAAAFLAGMAVTAAVANISVAADSPPPRPVEAPAAPMQGIGIAGTMNAPAFGTG